MRDNLTESEFSLKDKGYNMFPVNIDNKKGRGMIVYTRSSLNAAKIEISSDFDEVVWVELQLNGHDSLLIGLFYRSGSGTESNNTMMRELISQAMTRKHTYTCLIGDFNYPDINWNLLSPGTDNSLSEEHKFLECIQNNYLTQHITRPTRVRGTDTPHILDLILTDDERIIRDINYHSPLGKSDHAVLSFDILCYSKVQQYKKLKYFFDSANYEAMKRELASINWNEVLNTNTSVDGMWRSFIEVLSQQIDKHVQHRLMTCNRSERWSIPMDNRLRAIIKKKHRLWTRYMENRSSLRRRAYCKVRNKVTKLTKHLQREFERKLAKDSKTNPKAVWKYIHSKSKVKEDIADLYIDSSNPNSPTTSDSKKKANILASFYSSVFTIEPSGDVPRIPDRHCHVPMPKCIISEDLVGKKLSELNPNKSPGPDSLHPRLLKPFAPRAEFWRSPPSLPERS